MSAAPPDLPGVEHRYVAIAGRDGERLRLHVAEAGQGPPLLLLHGWPQHFWCWRAVIPALAGRFRVLAADLRGFGWSDAPGHGYDPGGFAADALALLDALELERASLLGHDWGGFASFLLAARRPDRVERLIAVSTPTPWIDPSPRLLADAWRGWYAALVAAPLLGPLAVARGARAIAELSAREARGGIGPEDVRLYAERLAEPARARASTALYRRYLAAAAALPLRPYRDLRLSTPALLLFGARDAGLSTRLLHGWGPHADELEVELVPGVGHFLPEQAPELLARRALDFLASG